jgi:hypothetical protein
MGRKLLILAFLLIAGPAWAQAEREIVASAKADLVARGVDLSGECGAFQITRLAAWRLRAIGAGLLAKTSGAQCQGFAVDVVAFPDGRTFDVLIDGGQANGPDWRQHLPHDPAVASRWRAAVDPGIDSQPGGGVVVQPQPVLSVDLSRVYRELEAIRGDQQNLYAQAERTYSDLVVKWEAQRQAIAAVDARLDQHDREPGWFTTVFGNRYVQIGLAAVSAFVTREMTAK